MRPDTKGSLDDIIRASGLIQSALAEVSLEEFLLDWEKQSAVERQFMIVGEALVRIRLKEPIVLEQIPDWASIIRFRNLLVHGYDVAEPEIVYGIARTSLESLRVTVEAILELQ
jgi:uncharacterized protein with HEPN domain